MGACNATLNELALNEPLQFLLSEEEWNFTRWWWHLEKRGQLIQSSFITQAFWQNTVQHIINPAGLKKLCTLATNTPELIWENLVAERVFVNSVMLLFPGATEISRLLTHQPEHKIMFNEFQELSRAIKSVNPETILDPCRLLNLGEIGALTDQPGCPNKFIVTATKLARQGLPTYFQAKRLEHYAYYGGINDVQFVKSEVELFKLQLYPATLLPYAEQVARHCLWLRKNFQSVNDHWDDAREQLFCAHLNLV
jgi:hypothetical protein